MRSSFAYDVVGMGGAAVDFVGTLGGAVRTDAKQRLTRFARHAGGNVANALVGLARLGARACYLGKLGTDDFSRFLIDEFVREGVDTRHVLRREGAGPYVAMILVSEDGRERSIFWTDERVQPLESTEISRDQVAAGRVFYLDDYDLHRVETARAAVGWAREAGATVVMDAENAHKAEYLPVFEAVDFLVVGEPYAKAAAGTDRLDRAADFLLRRAHRAVVITRGAAGCLVRTGDRQFAQPAFPVQAADTTGCGDAFHAGFIHGVLRGWPLERTAEFASAVAALKCRAVGARTALPTGAEVTAFLAGAHPLA